MDNQKKSQEEVLKERIEELEKENKELIKTKNVYEEWWRKADAKNLELINTLKSVGTIIDVIYNSSKA